MRIKLVYEDSEELVKDVKNNLEKALNGEQRCNIYFLLTHFNPKGDTSHTYNAYMVLNGYLCRIASGMRYTGGGYDKQFDAMKDIVAHFVYGTEYLNNEQSIKFIKNQRFFQSLNIC